MNETKNVVIHNMTNEEYERAIKWKNTHNKPTWKQMMLDYINIKKAEEDV